MSDKKKQDKSKAATPSYPRQAAPSYPVQQQVPQGYVAGYNAGPPQGAPPPYSPYPTAPLPPSTTVIVQGGFEAGARFGTGATAHIPPPPPGVLPNVAQAVVSTGHQNVVVTQREQTIWSGSGDAGYTFM